MNRINHLNRLCACAAALVLCAGLGACNAGGGKHERFTLLSWNVQTFFDAETDGTEYKEFAGASSAWDSGKYQARVKRLCEALAALGADVVALQEIETEDIVYDLYNELCGKLAPRKRYGYACFAKTPQSAIGCAVLSRFPLTGLTVHQFDYRDSDVGTQPGTRPLLETTLLVGDKNVHLMVNHWKSKSGGEDSAAYWQQKQEAVLARRLINLAADSSGAALVCGDFNRDISGFWADGEHAVTLSAENGAKVSCESGWRLFPHSAGEGSYYYRDVWEKIDHIFTAGQASLLAFEAKSDGAWTKATSSGNIPFRYALYNGAGYSDHLPVWCQVTLDMSPSIN
jgi:endonuclease/exonuclease/phosphatase family metal-dependent hydrolase